DTIGTMSIGERGVFNAAYEPLLFDVARIPFPAPGREWESVAALERLCAAGDVAALVLEPLVLGAGGMRMYGAETLARLAGAAQRAGALLIADEVMTGWGRTGTLFACEQAGVAPDLLCLSKGITGGSLPLAVTLATPEIFEAHYSEDRRRTFYHSSSYTGSPVACAAAVANLEIWDEEPVLERIARVGALQEAGLARFAGDPRVAEIRRTGTIAALRLKAREAGYLSEIGPTLYRFFQARDLLLRPLGDTLYVMPPYCSTEDDLARVYDAIAEAVDAYC
ncbi:MAG: aminotransferase class III-fold pyridoxal phosphate-dependent enzyme, partial [Pseudomonadota bacterium]